MISQHNWFFDPQLEGYECVSFRDLPVANQRRMTDCKGCGAKVSISEVRRYERRNWLPMNLHSRSARYPRTTELETMDKLWHEELRPMAELCSLVEEANGSQA